MLGRSAPERGKQASNPVGDSLDPASPPLPRGRPPGRTYGVTAALLGAVLPTLAAWVVTVGPAGVLRYDQAWLALATAAAAHGARALGTALLLLMI